MTGKKLRSKSYNKFKKKNTNVSRNGVQFGHSLLQFEGGHALSLNLLVKVGVDLVESTRETLVVGVLQVDVHVSLGDGNLLRKSREGVSGLK